MKLNETDRHNDWCLNDLDQKDAWTHKGGRDKLNGGWKIRRVCPQCGHHAFEYAPSNGRFICWYCHAWGRLADRQFYAAHELERMDLQALSFGYNTPKQPAKPQKPTKQKTERMNPSTINDDITLADYMPLSADELAGIADIATGEQVSGHQFIARQYLASIGITPAVAAAHRLGIALRHIRLKDEDQGKQRLCIAYRGFVEGHCCNVKFRSINLVTRTVTGIDGQQRQVQQREKGFDQLSSFTPCAPYHIDCLRNVPSGQRVTLYITEGEKDCLTLLALGYRYVISVASGAQTDHSRSFRAFVPWLAAVHTVVVCGDQDQKGREMAVRLADYFDDREVRVVRWDQRNGGKDITDLYLSRGADRVRQVLQEAAAVERTDILTFATPERMSCVLSQARGAYDKGYDVGLGPITDRVLHLNSQGGLIIVTGVPNAGKTDFLTFLTARLMAHRNQGVCYCLFETPDKSRHLADLVQLWVGDTPCTELTDQELMPFVEAVSRHTVHLSMRHEKPTPARVLAKAESALRAMPHIGYLVIDPYLYLDMGAGRNVTETESIKTMLTTVQDWAHAHRIWVFLVAHPRKLQSDEGTNEYEEVNMYTIANSAHWANISDFILSVKRVNRPAQRIDYTRVTVLKVRDQKLCRPGDVFFQRQSCGRYDERATEEDCIRGRGSCCMEPWEVSDSSFPMDGKRLSEDLRI